MVSHFPNFRICDDCRRDKKDPRTGPGVSLSGKPTSGCASWFAEEFAQCLTVGLSFAIRRAADA